MPAQAPVHMPVAQQPLPAASVDSYFELKPVPVLYVPEAVVPARPFVPVLPVHEIPTPPASADLVSKFEKKQEDKASGLKRKHVCKTCARLFTTLGHLARHNRTHTGERKHMCAWPQCGARFARQDNCMQHYKTHMNGKSKRNRVRTYELAST